MIMIKNENQHRITTKLARKLEGALAVLPKNAEFKAMHRKGQSAYVSSLKAQLLQFHSEIKEYETLKAGNFNFKKFPSLDEIPRWLIQARIAKGLRQEDLGKLLKLKKQQIQHYESTNYAGASLSRIQAIAEVLRR
jgi:HTH-type transcriptional regulator / antitoxin HigA